ncbi:hypothetical protein CKM354_000230400 [Cercospora kikuchii]|uniref:NACHT domain-containing protein n=1 Tax=Cercospora kikuchii TaxID=84275 RepID=A0A9P3CFB5_9PEZI|nr:uncharacterized protein CKM354_000230400 [Cercospora kikuchii]GIZ38905.1 hypothetical protein CKM354_000230400 [Cercospora kikuchii]
MHLLSLDEHGELSLGTYDEDKCPPYAILSHTWYADEDEVNYNDVIDGRGKTKPGRDKIMFCGNQARKDDLKHFWVDSCCIDKSSSADLSESLNSMFRWYKRASKCYVYLSDVRKIQDDDDESAVYSWKIAFQNSRWFTRGWTLQELLAPKVVEFWSSDRHMIGTKAELSDLIHNRTNIPQRALEGAPLSTFSVKERFRWAAPRETKRAEDKAYCLLGIFEVHMAPIYGEGGDHASERLEKVIHDRLRLSPQDEGSAHHDRNDTMNAHRKSVLASLGFPELGARQANIRNVHKNTCEWVLEHVDYSKWSSSDRRTFWIVGKPGAGKSTLMKFLHSKASERKSEYEFVFGFFFNARGNTLEKTTNGMYRALLFELFKAFPKLQTILDGKKPSSEWTLHSLKHLLSDVIQKVGPRALTLFIDALDECDEQEIQEMVEVMEDIQDNFAVGSGMLSICFASRHYPSIMIRNGIRMNLDEATGHLDDLNVYIEQRLQMKGEGTMVHEICEKVQRKANGVFLWAVLVIDILNKEIRRGRMRCIKTRLEEMPSGLSALFLETLRRDDEEMEEFLLCIQWILFAAEPLSLAEFYFAMESGLQDHSPGSVLWRPDPWDRERVTFDQIKRYVQSSSKGLAEVVSSQWPWDRKEPTVQFIHESIPDFFVKDGHLADIFPDLGTDIRGRCHEKLKSCCLNYLALDSTEVSRHHDLDAIDDIYPFLRYANDNVLYHANGAAVGIAQDTLLEIYPSEHHINIVKHLDQKPYEYSAEVTLPYLAAERGLSRLIAAAKEKGYDIWEQLPKEQWRCAAIAAFVRGRRYALEAIFDGVAMPSLDKLALDPGFGRPGRVFDWCDHTDLDRGLIVWASECGNWGLAESLTYVDDHNGILLGDGSIGTASQHALVIPPGSSRMHVLEYLLANVPWFNAGMALVAAVHQDQRPIVRCILDHNNELKRRNIRPWESVLQTKLYPNGGIPPDDMSASFFWGTAVCCFSGGGQEMGWDNIVAYAFKCAIVQGQMAIVRLFLDKGTNVNAESGGCYPLQVASAVGNSAIVRLLLDSGADIEAQVRLFGSASQAASVEGKWYNLRFPYYDGSAEDQTKVVQILLGRGANVKATSENNRTALYSATEYGRQKIMELLLDRGADIDAVSGTYGSATALQLACSRGDAPIVRFLLDRGADMSVDGAEFGPALQAAVASYNKDIIRMLLEHGAEINARSTMNSYYRTALDAAAYRGHADIASLLIELGADIYAYVDVKCCYHGDALFAAARAGSCDILFKLLDRGVDVNARSEAAGNALRYASSCGETRMAELLLDRDAGLNFKFSELGNALIAADRSGHRGLVSFWLDRGVDTNTLGQYIGIAFYYACLFGYQATAELFLDRDAGVISKCSELGDALVAAAGFGYTDVVSRLLDIGANINARPEHETVLTMLLDRGADVNACGVSTGTALYYAFYAGNRDAVELLLDRGADMYANSGNCGSTLQAACETKYDDARIVELLLNRDSQGNYGKCLFWASRTSRREVVRLLLSLDVPINDYWLGEALEAATIEDNKRSKEIVQLLLSSGASYPTTSAEGSSLTV